MSDKAETRKMKLPAFQFYPADWRKDPGIQALSRHDRSVWFDMLCIMHESDERGVLLLAGKPIPEDALARILNLDNQTCNQTLTTLLTYGVASRREKDGAIYSRRMVRDQEIIQIRRNAGKLGGNPVLLNQNPTTGDKQKPTPSSSSSSSDKNNPPKPPKGGKAGTGDELFPPELPPAPAPTKPSNVLPDGWKKLSKTERNQTRVQANSKLMVRIGKWFNRREANLWTIAEALALQAVNPSPAEIETMECFYLAEIDGDKDIRRRALVTLLNNWNTDLDRARVYLAENGINAPAAQTA